jgi:hypothetical protein
MEPARTCTGRTCEARTNLLVCFWLDRGVCGDRSFVKILRLVLSVPDRLAAFINLRLGNDGRWWVLGTSTAIYLVHAWFYFRSKTFRRTLILFGLLVALLTVNVAECRAQLPVH